MMICPACRKSKPHISLVASGDQPPFGAEYRIATWAVKVSRRKICFQLLERNKSTKNPDHPLYFRQRYTYKCFFCNFEWDVIWPGVKDGLK